MSLANSITYALLFVSLYFEVFLLVAFLERRFRTVVAKHRVTGDFPTVAIVVPCYNEEKTVAMTIRSLLSLDYPRDKLEILVIDDGSNDGTLSVVQKFAAEPQVRIFQKENGGKHTAMNMALENTNAELIGCLDADSIASSDALLQIAPVFDDKEISAVTPGIHVKAPQTMLQHMQHVEYRLSIFNRFMLAALGAVFITPGPFSIFRTSVVRELGGWRYGHSTEDMEMALRLQSKGHLIANAPKAVIHTGTPRTLRELFRQRVRWNYGWLRNGMDYRHMFGNPAYGNLGIIILPAAIISIFTGIYFFVRITSSAIEAAYHSILRIQVAGLSQPSFDAFYINTSMSLFLVYVSVGLILVLICAGSFIGTGSRRPPIATPLFLLFYSFLAPLWLGAAVVRALFRTGVRWR